MVIRTAKRTQHCTFCKNHGLSELKKGHQCPYANCPCLLCKLTKKAQVAMRHQQRVWRHQKQKLKIQGNDTDTSTGEKLGKGQACDKCRNHNSIEPKRSHECPYQDCSCQYCSLTFKRREIMKHQQRVRRSKIMSQVASDEKESTEDGNGPKDEDDDVTGNDTDNNSKDSTYDKEFDNASSDFPETNEEISPCSPIAQLLPLPGSNHSNELESLSAQFSSLEADYPIQMVPDLEPIRKESNFDLGSTECNMSVPSPPPLLPLDGDKPSSFEDFRPRNQTLTALTPYEISASDPISLERHNDNNRDPSNYPHGFQMVESSQISTFMLLQSERYLSDTRARYYPTPRQGQQPSGALKLSLDQSCANRPFDISLPTFDNRLNHSAVAASFTNFTQTPTMVLQQREYESQHPQQMEQLHRQHHRHQYRHQQRNLEQSYSSPYFHQSHLHL
ncbi:UNVERIFIED_CONTAM: hypothetical protein RMT77_018729 [Armadillidium vulgare]